MTARARFVVMLAVAAVLAAPAANALSVDLPVASVDIDTAAPAATVSLDLPVARAESSAGASTVEAAVRPPVARAILASSPPAPTASTAVGAPAAPAAPDAPAAPVTPVTPVTPVVVGVTRFVDEPVAPTILDRLHATLAGLVARATDALAERDVLDAGPASPTSSQAEAASAGAPAPASPAESVPPAAAAAVLAAAGAAAVGWAVAPRGALTGWLRRLAGILGLAGYSRIARSQVLDHDERARLFALVRDRPGMTLRDLVTGAECGRASVTHHLRVLEREGLVTSTRAGRVRLYFPAGSADGPRRSDAPALAALAHDTSRAIARAVAASPGLDQSAICERFGLTPSLAHWHARRLERALVVQKERDGRRVRYYPGPEAARIPDVTGA